MFKTFLFWNLLLNTCLPGYSLNKLEHLKTEKSSNTHPAYRQKSDVANHVIFLVCTREHLKCISSKANQKSDILNTYKMTKVLIHGWHNNEESPMPQTLKDMYLKYQDVNVIIVGWGDYSQTLSYSYALEMKSSLATCIADFLLRNLSREKPELSVHLIGHSLGAHICGYVGALLKQRNHLAYRITGLDPVALLVVDGLKSGDAYFVDIIHTSADMLGQMDAIGDIDFYPNGGTMPQPGCSTFLPQCSHSYSWKLFRQSIENGSRFPALECTDYTEYLSSNCGKSEYMGEKTSVKSRGSFYLDTKNEE